MCVRASATDSSHATEETEGGEGETLRQTVNELESMHSFSFKKCFLLIMEEVYRRNKWGGVGVGVIGRKSH